MFKRRTISRKSSPLDGMKHVAIDGVVDTYPDMKACKEAHPVLVIMSSTRLE